MRNKGITLISLIVTIIIMIILAGATVNLITSGGIIDKTRETTKSYSLAEEREELEIAVTAAIDHITGEIKQDKLEEILGENWNIDIGDKKILCKSINNNLFTVSEDGTITLGVKDEEEKFTKLVFEEGQTVPKGCFYTTNMEEVQQGDDYVYPCDCYAASEEEIANNQMTMWEEGTILNYKGSIMPEVETFEDDGVVYCMDLGLSFGFDGVSSDSSNEDEEIGLEMMGDENLITTSSIDSINKILNGGISIYGYDKIKRFYLGGCKNLVDASKLDLSTVTNIGDLFCNCSALEKAPIIPKTIENIKECFDGCTSLTNITYEGTVDEFKNIKGCYNCGDNGLIVHCSNGDYILGE